MLQTLTPSKHSRWFNPQQTASNERLVNRWEKLFTLLPTGIVVIDGQGRVEDCNETACELLGEPLIGEAWVAIIERAFAPQADDGHEVSMRNGKRVSISTRALEMEPGQIVVITDMTETRNLQAKVNQQQRLMEMGEMAAQLAHQIRTPLASALLYTNLIKQQIDDSKLRHYADKVVNCITSLEQQVRDMLLFSRGGETITRELWLGELIDEFSRTLEPLRLKYAAEITLQPLKQDCLLKANAESLLGALQNLIMNAIQAARGTPVVNIRCEVSQSYVDLIVADQGNGMSEKVKAKVLQPFFTTKVKGTGLGLAVVHAVAKAHYGDVWLESTENVGTRIALRLPIQLARSSS